MSMPRLGPGRWPRTSWPFGRVLRPPSAKVHQGVFACVKRSGSCSREQRSGVPGFLPAVPRDSGSIPAGDEPQGGKGGLARAHFAPDQRQGRVTRQDVCRKFDRLPRPLANGSGRRTAKRPPLLQRRCLRARRWGGCAQGPARVRGLRLRPCQRRFSACEKLRRGSMGAAFWRETCHDPVPPLSFAAASATGAARPHLCANVEIDADGPVIELDIFGSPLPAGARHGGNIGAGLSTESAHRGREGRCGRTRAEMVKVIDRIQGAGHRGKGHPGTTRPSILQTGPL